MEAEEAEAQPQPKMLLERVASQLERLARDACSSPSVVEPPLAATASRKAVLQESVALMLQWCDDAREFDVCPKLRKLRTCVRDALPLLEQMFNGSWHEERVRHYCCLPLAWAGDVTGAPLLRRRLPRLSRMSCAACCSRRAPTLQRRSGFLAPCASAACCSACLATGCSDAHGSRSSRRITRMR